MSFRLRIQENPTSSGWGRWSVYLAGIWCWGWAPNILGACRFCPIRLLRRVYPQCSQGIHDTHDWSLPCWFGLGRHMLRVSVAPSADSTTNQARGLLLPCWTWRGFAPRMSPPRSSTCPPLTRATMMIFGSEPGIVASADDSLRHLESTFSSTRPIFSCQLR